MPLLFWYLPFMIVSGAFDTRFVRLHCRTAASLPSW